MAKKGKRQVQAEEKVEIGRLYSLEDAVGLIADLPQAKFDETVEIAINLGVDPRKAEEMCGAQ